MKNDPTLHPRSGTRTNCNEQGKPAKKLTNSSHFSL